MLCVTAHKKEEEEEKKKLHRLNTFCCAITDGVWSNANVMHRFIP
jgi:hypothetical protein